MNTMWSPWRSKYIQGVSDEESSDCFLCDAATSDEAAKHLVVASFSHVFVILNRYPYNSGHVMVVPKRHVSDLTDVSTEELHELFEVVQKSQHVLQSIYSPHGFNIGINSGRAAGAGVPGHLHVHVLPRWDGDTNFMATLADITLASEAIEETFTKVSVGFSSLHG